MILQVGGRSKVTHVLGFKHNKWTKLIEFLQSVKNAWFLIFLPPQQTHASMESTHSRFNYIIHHWRDHHVFQGLRWERPKLNRPNGDILWRFATPGRRNEQQAKSRRWHEPWKHCLVNVRVLEKIGMVCNLFSHKILAMYICQQPPKSNKKW